MTKTHALVLAFASLVGLAVACSSQGEGERCNSDEDCSPNLSCVRRTTLSGDGLVCCPPTGASSALCNAGTGGDIVNPDAQGGVTEPDAGGEPDASEETDAGDELDASEETDAGDEPDASEEPDANNP